MPGRSRSLDKALRLLSKVFIACLAIIIISLIFIVISSIGENTLYDETIYLRPGESKSYSLPPGMVRVSVNSDAPVAELCESLTGRSAAYGTINDTQGIGTIVVTHCTLSEPYDVDAIVKVRITTGVLNPFGYLW